MRHQQQLISLALSDVELGGSKCAETVERAVGISAVGDARVTSAPLLPTVSFRFKLLMANQSESLHPSQ